MNPKTKNRIFVGIVAFIFIGSMAGALLYSTGDENKAPEIPTEHVLTQLSEIQRQFLISQGYIVVDAQIPDVCYLECSGEKMTIEQAAAAYNPAVFVVETTVQSGRDIIMISIDSPRAKLNPTKFNQTEMDNFICENTPFLINECMLKEIDFGNDTIPKKDSSNGTNPGNETQEGNASVTGAQNTSVNSSAGGGNQNGTN